MEVWNLSTYSEELDGTGEDLLQDQDVVAAVLVAKRAHVREAKTLEETLAWHIALADGALEQTDATCSRKALGLAQQCLGMPLPLLRGRYCEMKDLGLIPLHLLDLDAGKNVV